MTSGDQAGTREAKQVKQIKRTTPPLQEANLGLFRYCLECYFSCISRCPIFHNVVAIWCPKVPNFEVLGCHFDDIVGVG